MKKTLIIVGICILIASAFLYPYAKKNVSTSQVTAIWKFQSVDTMKYSRDLAREKLSDPSFDTVINQQVKQIAETGATHVAIATPYDEEFFPILQRWVLAARKNNLKIWFRGNFSGWEKWFDYKSISREEHIQLTSAFISSHPYLFEDGDIFSPCPECENGGPGDPRMNGDAAGHKKFLIDEYAVTKKLFSDMHKDVASNYASMNGDVARLIMDKETTKALDGVVTIDHYVKTADQMISDIKQIAHTSGGKIVIGEFGAPIPDIHGNMTDSEQAAWISDTLVKLALTPEVIGINYWVNLGGSTQLWTDEQHSPASDALTTIYSYKPIAGIILNEVAEPISGVEISSIDGIKAVTDSEGKFVIPFTNDSEFTFTVSDYTTATLSLPKAEYSTVTLRKTHPSFLYRLRKLFTISI